jgi:condensin complex subunit 1
MRQAAVVSLDNSLKVNMGRLWKMGVAEEEFVNLFCRISYQLLENASTLRNSTVKTCLLRLIAVPICQFNCMTTTVSAALIPALNQYEHLPGPVAELLFILKTEFNNTQLASEILREIGRMNFNAIAAHDSAGVKNIANFLSELSAILPSVVLSHISMIVPHLSGGKEAYTMRSAVVTSIGNILANVLCNGDAKHDAEGNVEDDNDDRDEEKTTAAENKTRDELLDILEERVFDINGYTRTAVLRTWAYLCEARAIPLSRLQTVTEIAHGRLSDKTALVRKGAIQLLEVLLEQNPFTADMNPARYQKGAEDVVAWMEANPLPVPKEVQEAIALEKAAEEGGDDAAETDEEEEDEKDADEEQEEEAEGNEGDDSTPAAPEDPEEEQETPLQKEHTQKKKLLEFFVSAVRFIRQMEATIPMLAQLLGSRCVSDVQATLRFLVKAFAFKLPGAKTGIRRLLTLIWNREPAIKQEVVNTFHHLFVTAAGSNGKEALPGIQVAMNIINLIDEGTVAELTSLEEIVRLLMTAKLLPEAAIAALWDVVGQRRQAASATLAHKRGAVSVLSMVAAADPQVIDSAGRLSLLVDNGIAGGAEGKCDYGLVRVSAIALQKLVTVVGSKKSRSVVSLPLKQQRIVSDAVEKMQGFLCNNTDYDASTDRQWYPAAEQVVNAIFCLSDEPEKCCEPVVKALSTAAAKSMEPEADGDANAEAAVTRNASKAAAMSKLFFVLGHVALKLLVHTEALAQEVKDNAEKSKNGPGTKSKSGKGSKSKGADSDEDGGEEGVEDAMEKELGMAAEEELEQDKLVDAICETEIVGKNLLGAFGPLIVQVVGDFNNQVAQKKSGGTEHEHNKILRQSAVLALCKFMCVSSKFCESHLQLLFTILQSAPDAAVRANVIVALGDLAFRFPNAVEPWTHHLYARLQDKDVKVRKNTLQVLTHLILNDMVKVKGQVCGIALCLEDSEQRIRDLARMFFHELSKRGNNPIYNLLPDVIGLLSKNGDVTQATFKSVLRFLLQKDFMPKEKLVDSLVEKICHRFPPATEDAAELKYARNLSFCLSCLPFSEKTIRKLSEQMKLYKVALADVEVLSNFLQIIEKASKQSKADMQQAAEEWQEKFEEIYGSQEAGEGEGLDIAASKEAAKQFTKARKRQEASDKAEAAVEEDEDEDEDDSGKATKKNKAATKRASARGKKSTKKKSKKASSESDEESESDVELLDESDEEEVEEVEEEEEEEVEVKPTKKSKKSSSAGKGTKKKSSTSRENDANASNEKAAKASNGRSQRASRRTRA